MTADELRTAVDAVPMWWHSLDLGFGVTTPGINTSAMLQDKLAAWRFPDLRHKAVLEIGAWDGFFCFEAERRGARRVTALDHYVWSVDWRQALPYRRQCAEQGIVRQEWPHVPGAWRPDSLPGKQGFDLARRALNSKVEDVVADFMEVDLQSLGTYDVVFFLGVLYHMRHPLLSLQRLAAVTREIAIIETAAIEAPGAADIALCEFYETTELNGDPSNWWAPNRKALAGMCRAAGFRQVEIVTPPPQVQDGVLRYRLCAHALK
jgi:tRNA (mo5U34)-methyltransferase